MENPIASQVHYNEYLRQTAWLNEENWKFERPEKRHRAREATAKALIHLAALLAADRRETHTA